MNIFKNMNISLKLGVGFGITIMIFLILLFRYQVVLNHTLSGYDNLLKIDEAMKSRSNAIHVAMLEARRSEKDFLARKQLKYADRVGVSIQKIIEETRQMEVIGQESGNTENLDSIKSIIERAETYLSTFKVMVSSWERKGLDHKSGIQGEFRSAAHQLEEIFNEYDIDELKITLLQIRRAEKDFTIRKQQKYVNRLNALAREFQQKLKKSTLSLKEKDKIRQAMERYQKTFIKFVRETQRGQNNKTTVNQFRMAAHLIEASLTRHYVPGIRADYLLLRRFEKDYMLRKDKKYVQGTEQVAEVIAEKIDNSLIDAADKKAVKTLLSAYILKFNDLVTIDRELSIEQQNMRKAVHAIEPLIELFVQKAQQGMTRRSIETKTRANDETNSIIIISTIVLIMGIVMVFFIIKMITHPIKAISQYVQKYGEGDLTATLDIDDTTDELGVMASALKVAMENIQKVIIKVRQATDSVTSGSIELSTMSQQVSEGATEQAASVEETSSSIEQMSSNIQQSAENSQETERISQKAAADALSSGKAVEKAVSAMTEIAGKISIIEEISRQTNLLALNAAIEAARAGEHGKGFAVVAAEVRKLAERSQAAASEISGLSRTTVGVAEQTGEMLSQLVPDIQKTSNLVQEISASSQEQNSGAHQITQAIQQLDIVIQQNSAATEEIASTSEGLASQATQLKDAISFFKIAETEIVECSNLEIE